MVQGTHVFVAPTSDTGRDSGMLIGSGARSFNGVNGFVPDFPCSVCGAYHMSVLLMGLDEKMRSPREAPPVASRLHSFLSQAQVRTLNLDGLVRWQKCKVFLESLEATVKS